MGYRDVPDNWAFILDESREYTVKGFRKLIGDKTLNNEIDQVRWNTLLPIKINIASWRIAKERLPTRSNLDRRGVNLHTTRCLLCDDDQETEIHLFINCSISKEIWSAISTWWKLGQLNFNNIHDLLCFSDSFSVQVGSNGEF